MPDPSRPSGTWKAGREAVGFSGKTRRKTRREAVRFREKNRRETCKKAADSYEKIRCETEKAVALPYHWSIWRKGKDWLFYESAENAC